MSVWKKASKAHQKTHKERHQPSERNHLGLLEKKKDYIRRARDYNEKKATLKLLHKRALNKNPDEFYHHMINSKIENGQHFETNQECEDTPEQIRLMQTQDLKYIVTKRTMELKKIEKLQSQLHLSSVKQNRINQHKYFEENREDDPENTASSSSSSSLLERELPDVDLDDLVKASKKRKQLYNELAKRISRERELAVVQQKIEMQRHLQDKKNVLPAKRVKKGSKNNAPVYIWKYERKR